MRQFLSFFAVPMVVVAVGAIGWIAGAGGRRGDRPEPARPPVSGGAEAEEVRGGAGEAAGQGTYPDPNAPGTKKTVFLDPILFDNDISGLALGYTGPVGDEGSLEARAEAIRGRSGRGLADLGAKLERLKLDTPPTLAQANEAIRLTQGIAYLHIYEGRFDEAARRLERVLELAEVPGVPAEDRARARALLGVIALRRGELDNCIACLGPSSCIFPIEGEAVHQNQAGSREAIEHFSEYLETWPGDLRVRWLLNVAYMTLGEYPDKVPPQYLVPLDRFRSEAEFGRFKNVASLVGLNARGTGLAGGSIFDDFDGDDLPDLFVTSLDADRGASLFVNKGDGTFADRSSEAGLDAQVYALNVARADFDNDGNLDVLMLRGGWEHPTRLTLLRNKGGGSFEDVTEAAGMAEPIATESAAWGDYDNDGFVDLFVCGEFHQGSSDFRNLCRLYHNRGDGTFEDVAPSAGVTNERYAKGAAWGDYDGDGRLDLFVSNMSLGKSIPCRLYHNEGDGTFRDVAEERGIVGSANFFASTFVDYDNDGRLDLFVGDFGASLADVVADYLGIPVRGGGHLHVYRNEGDSGFREVSREVGLGRPMGAMGVNFGDLDNDGFLDLHLGNGWMSYAGLFPDLTFKNVGGARFADVTEASGTGHLQKGHGVSFADWDSDGDLDFFVVFGGGYPGDKGHNALFQNPGAGGHWLKVKLVGTKTNRAAIGARIRAEIAGPDGTSRTIHRMVGTNASFGGNSLVELLGLGGAESVATLTITWPTSGTTQVFRDVAADRSVVITEGDEAIKVLEQRPIAAPRP